MSLPKAGCFHSLPCFVCFPSTAWKHICFSVLQSASGSWFFTGFPANLSPSASQLWGNCNTPGPSLLLNTPHAFSPKAWAPCSMAIRWRGKGIHPQTLETAGFPRQLSGHLAWCLFSSILLPRKPSQEPALSFLLKLALIPSFQKPCSSTSSDNHLLLLD